MLAFLLSSQAAATFQGLKQEWLGGRAGALAGADVAAPQDSDALLRNPAALPEAADIQLVGYFGRPASGGRDLSALGLSGGWWSDLRLGLVAGLDRDARFGDHEERSAALVMAMETWPGVSLGLRLNTHQMQNPLLSQAVTGANVDLGLHHRHLPVFALPGHFTLGFSLDNVAGLWSARAWSRAVPGIARAGVGYQPHPSLYLGGERVWESTLQLPVQSFAATRLGLQWQPLNWLWLRGGYAFQDKSEGRAGAGLKIARGDAALQYSYLHSSAGAGHRLGLNWTFQRVRKVSLEVQTEQMLKDPADGHWLQARLKVVMDPGLRPQAWKVTLVDEQGATVRELSVEKNTARHVNWDGRDSHGHMVGGHQRLWALLQIKTMQGPLEHKSALTLERSYLAWRLRQKKQDLQTPSLTPVFADANAKELSHVVMSMPAAIRRDLKFWEVDIQSGQGELVRRLQGEGVLPKELIWDGLDSSGRKVKSILDLQIAMKLTEKDGTSASQSNPLFTQELLELAARDAANKPDLRLFELGLSLLSGRSPLSYDSELIGTLVDEARKKRKKTRPASRRGASLKKRGVWVLDVFADKGSDVLESRRYLLKSLLKALAKNPSQTVRIMGSAGRGGAADTRLARSRAMSLAGHLHKFGPRGLEILLRPAPENSEFKGVRVELD